MSEISDRTIENSTFEDLVESLVAFVKMLSLYNVMNPTTKSGYVFGPETSGVITKVARSLFMLKSDMVITALLFNKKECAEKITYLFQISI